MIFRTAHLRFEVVVVVAVLISVGILAGAPSGLAQSPETASCSTPEYRQFDFWVGDWDGFDVSEATRSVAHLRVEHILNGCVIKETYDATNGMEGQSFSIYDRTRGVWHQSWVTSRGVLLTIEGKMQGGEMVLSGTHLAEDGHERLVRGSWKAEDGGVRETAVTSMDGGRTWTPWFDMIFRPRAGTSNDGATVAALDTRYQAAVKNNDAVTMDSILADDFILVVGSGKTFTKADLLKEARDGITHYEHQEDSEQKVRVFGDTAVVTAKLWGKGSNGGKPFDKTLWFSDTYVRTASGWRYVFGQASLALPAAQ